MDTMENILNVEIPQREVKYQEPSITEMAQLYRDNNLTPVADYASSAQLWSNERLDKGFLGDPLDLIGENDIFRKAFGDNEVGRNEMRSVAKKALVTNFYAKQFRLSPQIAEQGFDEITRQIFGKDMSVDDIYNSIREIKLREAQNDAGILEKSGRNLYAGIMGVDKGLADTTRMVVDAAEAVNRSANYLVFEPLEWVANKLNMPDLAAYFHAQNFQNAPAGEESIIEKTSNWLRSYSEAEQKAIEHQIQWAGEDNFLWQFVRNAPQIGMAIALSHLQSLQMANKLSSAMNVVNTSSKATSAASMYFGTTSAASEWYDTENSTMSNAERFMNALAVGGAEYFFEQELGVGRLFRKYWSKALPEKEIIKLSEKFGANFMRTVKSIGLDSAVEGLEEVGTGITQRFSNLLYGKDGKTLASMSMSDIAYELLSPVANEFAVGALSGGVMGTIGFKHRYQNKLAEARNMNFNSDRIVVAKKRLAELEKIEAPTQENIAEIEWLKTNIAERNYAALWNNEFKKYMENLDELENDKLSNKEYAEKLEKRGLSALKESQSLENAVTENQHLEAIDSLINQSLKSLKLDGIDLQLVKSVKDLPPELRANGAEGVFDGENNRIYLVAENLTAGRVKKVILHEAVGHKGLRLVLGENYDGFLRQIGSEHAEDIQKIAQKRNFNLEDKSQYLEAVDEFIAEMAENGFDNGIFGRIVAKFRMLLRRLGLDIAYSDNELRELFRRSRNALRNANSTTTEDTRFAFTEDGNYFPAPDEWGTAYTSMTGKGLEAINFLLDKKDGFVPAAFHRKEIGDIDIVYGEMGKGLEDKGGYGLAHIRKRHPDINWNKIIDTINNGEIKNAGKGKKALISDNGKVILFINQKGRNWVITAFSNTSAEEILSASAKNGSDAFYRKGITTIGEIWEKSSENQEKLRFSLNEGEKAENFKNWFGDSKVVDENGEPLVVYHGTNADFNIFDTEKFGAWFSKSIEYAESMMEEKGGNRVVECYLSIQNPMTVKLSPQQFATDTNLEKRLIEEAKAQGYDGLIIENDTDNEIEKDIFYVVFNSNQIKSATDNIGTFDKNNPDIRFSFVEGYGDYPIDQKRLKDFKEAIYRKVNTMYTDIADIETFLLENGINYDPAKDSRTLNAAIQLARKEKAERNAKIRTLREHTVMAKKDPFYKILSQKYGKDFKINAGTKYDGVEFTGNFMDKHKTEKGRQKAKSIPAEEAAKLLSEKLGREISVDSVVEHFRNLKKEGLLAEYRENKRNKRYLAELAAQIAEEDRMELTNDEFLGGKTPVETEEMKESRKRYIKEQAKYRKADEERFLQENMPELYTWVMEILSVGSKIKPSLRFQGEEFTGDWIPREWKVYSKNNPGKKTGLKLLQYEQRRKNALQYSAGMASDEIAQAITSKYGGDAADIEEQIINLFRDLKRSDLHKMYIEAKLEEKNQEKEEFAEYDAHNAAESFRLLLEEAQQEKVNLIRIQDLAKKHVKKYIPPDMQGMFIDDIVKLNNYSDKPSPAYPEGRRAYELEKLLERLHSFNAKQRIMELLDGTRVRVNSAGIPISNFGDNLSVIAQIRDIIKLTPLVVENKILDLNDRIAQAEIDAENGNSNAEDPNQLRVEKGLYEMFGKLDLKTPEELGYALKELRYLIDQNKQSLFFRLKNKLQENATRNYTVMQEVSGKFAPNISNKPKDPDKKLNKFWVSNAGLKNLLHLITGKSNENFEDTELGKLYAELENATWEGAALDRKAMENASQNLYKFFGLKTLKQKKNFFKEINETPEHTGIYINRFSSEKTSHFDPVLGEDVMIATDRRGYVKGKISVAHARQLLAEYDLNNNFDSTNNNLETVNNQFNSDIDKQLNGDLPNGYIYQLGKPSNILLSTNIPDLPIELSASHLNKKANQENHIFDIQDLKDLPYALNNPVAIFEYGDKDKAQNIIVEIQKDGKNFLVGLSLNYHHDGLDVNSIRGLFPKETANWLNWIQEGKALYLNKEKVQSLITQQQTNFADVSNPDLNSVNNIVNNFENANIKSEKNQKNYDLGIEFLRQQLNDFDLGIDRVYDLFGNEDENESWKIITDKTGKKSKKELEKTTQLLYIKPLNPELEKTSVAEWSGSKAEAANILMAWEQPDVQMKMRWNGWTDESITQLKEYIGDNMINYAYFLRDTIKKNSERINKIALEIYGVGLPQIENYFPTSYSESLGKKIGKTGADGVVGDSYGNLSISPNFLISRKFHLGEIDLNRSIFDSYLKYSVETNHFIAFAQVIRKSRSILNNRDVRNVIVENYGKEVYDQILDRIKTIADGGRAGGEAAKMLGKLFRYWVPSKIALNLSSFAKQIAGSVNYINSIPFADYVKYTKDSFTDTMFEDFIESIKDSDYYKNRQAGAMNRDLYHAIKSMGAGTTEDIYGSYLLDSSTKLTRKGDSIAMLRGGYAIFKYHYQAAKAEGSDDKTAWQRAMQLYQRVTDETQQSGYLKDQNYFQSQAGFYRYLTAFLSNPTQIMNLQLETINDLRFGTGKRKAEAKQKLKRQLIINHIVLPFLMTAITQFFRHGRDFDEYEWEDFLTAFLLGPFEGAFIAGKIASSVTNEIADIIADRHKFGTSAVSAVPILDESLLAMLKIIKNANEDEFSSENLINIVQGLADLSIGAGSVAPVPNLGAIGSAASAVIRESKRLFRLGKNLSGIED